MARRSKNARKRDKHQRQRDERTQLLDEVAQDTAARFTCSTEIADDFAAQCASDLDELESALAFNRVAVEMWTGQRGRAEDLAAALVDLLQERRRHFHAVLAIADRFNEICQDEAFHQHLEPIEHYRDFVRRRLFDPNDAPPTMPSDEELAALPEARPSDSDVF